MRELVTLTLPAADPTPALRLRPWHRDDAADLAAAHRDPLLRRWLLNPVADVTEARQTIDKAVESWENGTAFGFCVREAETGPNPGRLLGAAVVKMTSDFGDNGAEVGYWTAAPARGRGVAPRAMTAAGDWALAAHPELERLELLHTIGNVGSCRVAAKSGFALDRELPPFPPQFPEPGHLHVRVVTQVRQPG